MKTKDRRYQRTEKRIFKAFYDLFLENDLTDITVNDISELADINRSTFYLHFDDKFALLDAYLYQLLPIADDFDFNHVNSQKEVIGKLYDHLTQHLTFFKRLFNYENYPFAIHSVRTALRQFFTVNQAYFPEQLGESLEFTIHIRIAGLVAMVEWYLEHQSHYSREQFIRETTDMVRLLDNHL